MYVHYMYTAQDPLPILKVVPGTINALACSSKVSAWVGGNLKFPMCRPGIADPRSKWTMFRLFEGDLRLGQNLETSSNLALLGSLWAVIQSLRNLASKVWANGKWLIELVELAPL